MYLASSRFALIAILGALSLPTSSAADDTDLYPQALPSDAAFIRTFTHQTPSEFDGVRLEDFDAETCRDYCAVSAALLPSTEPNTFFSLFTGTDGALHVLQEPNRGPASKVNLIVINADTSPVRLLVPGKNISVVDRIEPDASGSRAVNPVSTKLAVVTALDSKVLGSFDLSLSRGQDITFFVRDGQVTLIKNAYGPVLALK